MIRGSLILIEYTMANSQLIADEKCPRERSFAFGSQHIKNLLKGLISACLPFQN